MSRENQRFFFDNLVFVITCSALILLLVVLLSPPADADGAVFSAHNQTWQSECGSCHVPYPPPLLPAASWRAIMAGLDQHFGTDASVDANSAAEIGAFLQQHAGRERGNAGGKPMLRITELGWFRHEHGEELPASIWNHAKVKSAANCGACHTRAETGDYSENSLRLPR
jgi:hypothetical protein